MSILKSWTVNISWKPRNVKIETPRNTLDLAAYEQYELICSADANPPASFTWKIRHPNTTNPVLKHWNFNQGNLLFKDFLVFQCYDKGFRKVTSHLVGDFGVKMVKNESEFDILNYWYHKIIIT